MSGHPASEPTGPAPGGADPAEDDGPVDAAALGARLRELEQTVAVLDEVVNDFLHGDPPRPATADRGSGAGGGGAFEPFYPSLEEWVVDHFAPMYARPVSNSLRWCASWWDHAEAISRLEALWRTWEVARLDELRGMALWYRDMLDPQLAVLTSPAGPFASCTPDGHHPPKPLPTTPAPEGWWSGDDEPDGQPLDESSPYREAGG